MVVVVMLVVGVVTRIERAAVIHHALDRTQRQANTRHAPNYHNMQAGAVPQRRLPPSWWWWW